MMVSMSFLALADNLNRLHGVQYFRMTIRLRMVIPDYQTRVGIGRVRIRDFFIFRPIVSRAAPVFRRNRPEAGADSQKIKNPHQHPHQPGRLDGAVSF